MRNTPEETKFSEMVVKLLYMGYSRDALRDFDFGGLIP
jgi:hypothetical protein